MKNTILNLAYNRTFKLLTISTRLPFLKKIANTYTTKIIQYGNRIQTKFTSTETKKGSMTKLDYSLQLLKYL